jgi:hypothetical protein
LAAVVYLSALCKGESTNTVILIYRKRFYHKMFGRINVSCPVKFTYVVVSAAIYCSCMLLNVGLYSRNFEAHVIAVSLVYGTLLYLEHRCNFPTFLNDSSFYEKVCIHIPGRPEIKKNQ